MNDTFYKPLTPELRNSINSSIDNSISELRTCRPNAIVNMQINANIALKNIIKALPDGYPLPMEREVASRRW